MIKDGFWKGATAGGCPNHPHTYANNPHYKLTIDGSSNSQLLVELKGPKQYQIGFEVICLSTNENTSIGTFTKKSSGTYKYA